MGLSLFESFIVGCAVDVASRRRIVSPLECTRAEDAAHTIVAVGLKKAGFRFTPGLLASPWGHFYEGRAGVAKLRGY